MSELFKPYCGHCDKEVDYYLKEEDYTHNIKGKDYTIKAKTAFCCKCNNQVFHNDAHDFNLKALYDQYRKDNNLISLSEIREICSIYNIGKRPLSLLLGWGEITFTRYYNSLVPSVEYSDLLKKVRYEPQFFLELLEKNKDKITEAAYNKAKTAAQRAITDSTKSKLYYAALYLINKSKKLEPTIDKMRLQKYLYYAQGFCRSIYGHSFFTEECSKWPYGPVYESIYNKFYPADSSRYDLYDEDFSSEIPQNFQDYLTEDEIKILEIIYNNFGIFSSTQLSTFTHQESPWLEANKNNIKIISKDSLDKFFVELKFKYNIEKPEDISNYVDVLLNSLMRRARKM